MTAVETSAASLAESGLVVKMEDRKRPASYDSNESAPPSKKQATSVNGGGKPHPDADMPWRDDLERFQKDAIIRQMQEYKREKSSLETRLKELSKNTAYHDDHLRIIDAWFKQLIDEAKIILGEHDTVPADTAPFPSSLLFSDNQNFEKHLKARSDDIKSAITRLFSQSPKVSPEVADMQGQLSKKLAEERVAITELEKALSEKQQLEERLEAASLRYMVAEKKLDRAKSLTVAKLEKQHILGPHNKQGGDSPGSLKREDSAVPNGTGDAPERLLELEESNNKTLAVSEQQKDQLEKLEVENSKLVAQLTELNIKFSKLSDEDYAQTDLFKQLKSQHEDVIKRINHLEAINVQLREEAEKLQAERTAYRIQVENEAQTAVSDKEAQLAKAETDLARIRNARDELLADQQMRKAAQEQERTSIQQNKELLEAREARISSLESELERAQLRIDGIKEPNANIEALSLEDLRTKYQTLDRQYDLLNNELSSMQTAFKKTSKLAAQKIADFGALEDKVQRLTAEKSKADQKYFAAMKSKEARDSELRTLRIQNMKSSDIVTQLKDAETMTRTLVSNVEKQLSETKEMLANSVNQYRNSQQQVVEANIVTGGLKSQIDELKNLMVTKDSSLASATSSCRKAENEITSLKSSLSDTKKSLESWRSKGLGNSSTEYEMLRTLALCTVCRRTFKNTVIKTCGHVFCRECVEERLTSRSRKCPNCNKSFGNNDYLHITL